MPAIKNNWFLVDIKYGWDDIKHQESSNDVNYTRLKSISLWCRLLVFNDKVVNQNC